MDPVEALREFINIRLTAAAGEIFSKFQQTISQYQKEIQTQSRLLDIILKPQVKLHRTDVGEHGLWKEEQLCKQEMNSSLDEEAKPPQIKEEEEELCIGQEGEKLVLIQDVDTIRKILLGEPSEPEADGELVFSQDSVVAGNQPQEKGQMVDSGSSEQAEEEPNKGSHSENMDDPLITPQKILSDKMRNGTSERPHSCSTCNKTFSRKYRLLEHMRSHTGEKPHSCQTCGKRFLKNSYLLKHLRTHTGDKLFPCVKCDKSFFHKNSLVKHTKTHTVTQNPFFCQTCGKSFCERNLLLRHMRNHTAEKPFSCATCGKRFGKKSHLSEHLRIHTGERPHSCVFCGKGFITKSNMTKHIATHTK